MRRTNKNWSFQLFPRAFWVLLLLQYHSPSSISASFVIVEPKNEQFEDGVQASCHVFFLPN